MVEYNLIVHVQDLHVQYIKYSSGYKNTCRECFVSTFLGVSCFPQRAALLKSMLNFLKKAIPDPSFSDSIRHCKYH